MRILTFGWILILITTVVSSREKLDPCFDREIAGPLQLPPKYANLTPPWQLSDGGMAKVFQSDGFSYQWMWMKSLLVKGLGRSVQHVLTFLSDNNCLFVPVGRAVRQGILGQRRVFLSGEVSCDLSELHQKCVEKYEASLCDLYQVDDGGNSSTYRLQIGDLSGNNTINRTKAEPIVLHEWRSILGQSRDKWRFTVDTLASYDNGNGTIVVIDPLLNGFDHLCEKKLIPTSEDWSRWSESHVMKIMGFYELRADGFSAKNETLIKFISEELNVTDETIVQKFYCEHVLQGIANFENSSVCVTTPNKNNDVKAAKIQTIMVQDLGAVWNTSVGKAVEKLEVVVYGARQFAAIRTRLLHSNNTTYDLELGPEKQEMTENELTMFEDNSENVSRSMEAEPSILPPGDSHSSHASPTEEWKMVAPLHVEGTGSTPIPNHDNSKEKVENIGGEDVDEEDDDNSEEFAAVAYDIGTPVDPAKRNDYSRHNFMHSEIPVMTFKKVEKEDLVHVDASEINISH